MTTRIISQKKAEGRNALAGVALLLMATAIALCTLVAPPAAADTPTVAITS